jgi:hypothetical protein
VRSFGSGFRVSSNTGAEKQSVTTPHAARGWTHPPCSHFKIQLAAALGLLSRWPPWVEVCTARAADVVSALLQLARILEQTEDPRFPNFLSVTSLASSTTFRTLVQQNHRLQLDEDFEEDSGPVNAFVLKEVGVVWVG